MVKHTRKRLWIDRQIQGALAVRVGIHWCLFAVIVGALTLFLQFLGSPLSPLSEHLDNYWKNQGPFMIVMLLLLPIFLYDTIKLSNRFAGPVLRLRRVMQEMAEGKPAQKLNFRDHDFWRGLAADFNTLIDRGSFDQISTKPSVEEEELQEVG